METFKAWIFALTVTLVLLAIQPSSVAATDAESESEAENGAVRGSAAAGMAIMSTALAGLVAKIM